MIYIVNFNYSIPDGAIAINTTSRSSNWSSGLSPFYCGPVKLYGEYSSQNVENAWQYSKVYEYYTDDGEPAPRYFSWAEDGWKSTRAQRYPMGRGVVPLYSLWDGAKLSYVEARKAIYIPLYSSTVKKTSAFQQLKSEYKNNKDIYLIDFDAHNLEPKSYEYMDVVNNPKIKLGHAYVLAMMLENLI